MGKNDARLLNSFILLYADDCDLVSHSQADMQTIMDLFASAWSVNHSHVAAQAGWAAAQAGWAAAQAGWVLVYGLFLGLLSYTDTL